jgi:hypothetical protein
LSLAVASQLGQSSAIQVNASESEGENLKGNLFLISRVIESASKPNSKERAMKRQGSVVLPIVLMVCLLALSVAPIVAQR